jgi:hypothetical protein
MIYTPKRIFKGIYYSLSGQKNARILGRYVLNDILSLTGYYRHPCRIIFIAALPKSGSTWLFKMLQEIPGVNQRIYQSPVILDQDGRYKNNWDDISDSMFESNPKWGHAVYKMHTRYNFDNWEIMMRHVNQVIMLRRDLRDVCVSLYFHHKYDEKHSLYNIFHSLGPSEGIDLMMKIIKAEYIPWVNGWEKAAIKYSDKILILDYKDLWNNTRKELERIITHYGIKVEKSFYDRALELKLTKKQNLKENLQNYSNKVFQFSTARKGGTGGWKEYFSEKQKDEFKNFAGQLLIDMGYERDFDW